MGDIGTYAVLVILLSVTVAGLVRRVGVFDCFKEGAKEGALSLLSAAPSLFGLVVAVTMLEASGFFDILNGLVGPVCNMIGFPAETVPLALTRPVTGSGSFAVLNGILEQYHPDSVTGRAAAVMAGSTETTFYAIAVYYGSVGIKKTRYTLPAALTADMVGMLTAALSVNLWR